MPLQKYETNHKNITTDLKSKGTIASGVKSGDKDKAGVENELMVVTPLIQHPELGELYRAVDPVTGWKGWVKYTPIAVEPTPKIPPTPEEIKRKEYTDLLSILSEKVHLVTQGVYDETENGLAATRAEVKTLYEALNP